jgi:hypothetical protein
MRSLKINSKILCILILIISLLLQGITQISCSCGTDDERKKLKEEMGEKPAYLQEYDRKQKEIAERQKTWELLIERAALRKDGAPEEYINKLYPLPSSASKSNVNPADLPTQVEEIEEGANEDTGGGGGGSGYGY